MNKVQKLFMGGLMACVAASSMAQTFVGERTDFRDETIYFAMTTRFYDGDPTNNVCGWDHQDVQIENNDPDWRGDFKGLIDKLDYIKALGFTAIWITPIVQNCSGTDFHGYHAMDFSTVDLRYESRTKWGASQDVKFQDLIDAAHAKGMKVVLDIVLNHTGNFGEKHFAPLFSRSQDIRNQASVSASIIPNYDLLPSNYNDLPGKEQYNARFPYLKNTDGTNKDSHNYWHHVGTGWNWDYPNRWWGQIAGDCVDLNTENPAVSKYLVEQYGKFIAMGVDGFRIDTTGHISRLTFNTAFIPQFLALGEQYKSKRLNGAPFFMFGECCARFSDVTYRDQPNLSSYFYTWKSPQDLVSQWNWDETFWDNIFIREGDDSGRYGNMALCDAEPSVKRESDNVFMKNGAWHEPDYSDYSGFSIIDFPMHYNFNNAAAAVNVANNGDRYYNDASYNVVYVDSHDYCPGPNDGTRFNGGTEQWAENLSLMFTFRGIPCIYYGSEVEFQKGQKVDAGGTDMPVKNSGRAYFGHYLEGNVEAADFGKYSATGNVAETLNGDLSQHIIRLNQIRAAVPALRKGQYTFDGCSANGGWAFKRAYKDESFALVAINGGASFRNLPAGNYTDLVTGQTWDNVPADGSITVEAPQGKGQLRVIVKDWTKGKVGDDGKFIYSTSPVAHGGSVSFTDPGTTTYYFTVNTLSEVNCIFNHGDKKTPDIKGITSDVFYKYDGGTNAEKVNEVVTTEPRVSLSPNGGEFSDDAIEVTIRPVNCVSAWYSIDGGDHISLSHDATVTIGADKAIGESVVISWSATDASDVTKTGSATFTKVERPAGKTIYFDNSIVKWNPVYIYFYPEKNGWPGQEMEKVGEYLYKYVVPEETTVIVFNGGSNSNQTDDIKGADIVHNATYQATGGRNVVRLSGIEGVEATQSQAPVEYYNLQGIRVDNPANGIYIRRCGNVVTKVHL